VPLDLRVHRVPLASLVQLGLLVRKALKALLDKQVPLVTLAVMEQQVELERKEALECRVRLVSLVRRDNLVHLVSRVSPVHLDHKVNKDNRDHKGNPDHRDH